MGTMETAKKGFSLKEAILGDKVLFMTVAFNVFVFLVFVILTIVYVVIALIDHPNGADNNKVPVHTNRTVGLHYNMFPRGDNIVMTPREYNVLEAIWITFIIWDVYYILFSCYMLYMVYNFELDIYYIRKEFDSTSDANVEIRREPDEENDPILYC